MTEVQEVGLGTELLLCLLTECLLSLCGPRWGEICGWGGRLVSSCAPTSRTAVVVWQKMRGPNSLEPQGNHGGRETGQRKGRGLDGVLCYLAFTPLKLHLSRSVTTG